MILRLLTSPKWLGLTALAILAITLCSFAALWQWDRSQQTQAVEQARLAEELPVTEVLSVDQQSVPIEALGRQVAVVGQYLPGTQSLVRSRVSDSGEPGYWVVNGVQLDDGNNVAVLRGWAPSARVPEPKGEVAIVGRLQPDENFYPNAKVSKSEPLVTITEAGLAAQWQEALVSEPLQSGASESGAEPELLAGFVAATAISPADSQLEPLRPLIGSDPEVGFPLRNILYSLQWLIFVVFVIVMWWRWFVEDLREMRQGNAKVTEDAKSRVSLEA